MIDAGASENGLHPTISSLCKTPSREITVAKENLSLLILKEMPFYKEPKLEQDEMEKRSDKTEHVQSINFEPKKENVSMIDAGAFENGLHPTPSSLCETPSSETIVATGNLSLLILKEMPFYKEPKLEQDDVENMSYEMEDVQSNYFEPKNEKVSMIDAEASGNDLHPTTSSFCETPSSEATIATENLNLLILKEMPFYKDPDLEQNDVENKSYKMKDVQSNNFEPKSENVSMIDAEASENGLHPTTSSLCKTSNPETNVATENLNLILKEMPFYKEPELEQDVVEKMSYKMKDVQPNNFEPKSENVSMIDAGASENGLHPTTASLCKTSNPE